MEEEARQMITMVEIYANRQRKRREKHSQLAAERAELADKTLERVLTLGRVRIDYRARLEAERLEKASDYNARFADQAAKEDLSRQALKEAWVQREDALRRLLKLLEDVDG